MAAESNKRKSDQLTALFGTPPSQKQAKLHFKVLSRHEREHQLKLEEVDHKAENLKAGLAEAEAPHVKAAPMISQCLLQKALRILIFVLSQCCASTFTQG